MNIETRSVVFSGTITYETRQLPWLSRVRWAWALIRGKDLRLVAREISIHGGVNDQWTQQNATG